MLLVAAGCDNPQLRSEDNIEAIVSDAASDVVAPKIADLGSKVGALEKEIDQLKRQLSALEERERRMNDALMTSTRTVIDVYNQHTHRYSAPNPNWSSEMRVAQLDLGKTSPRDAVSNSTARLAGLIGEQPITGKEAQAQSAP